MDWRALWIAAIVATSAAAQTTITVPIKQITRLHGSMPNALTGFGLVTGLSGTGSSDKASRQMAANFIRNFDVNVSDSDLTSGSFAMVTVSAELPAFSHEGMRLDVTVSSIGDATSLFGGKLEFAELKGVDGRVYVTASGKVSVGGVSASGKNARVTKNHVTVGRIPRGGVVVEELRSRFLSEKGDLELRLINPSLATAQAVAIGIDRALKGTGCRAAVVDRSLVRITLPEDQRNERYAIRVLNLIRDVRVVVENPSVVLIDEARGVVLAGEGVAISPCVVALADLTISVTDDQEVVQPLPGINQGRTEVVNRTHIDITTENSELKRLQGGGTVADLLANLKALQLSPRQLIEVFQALSRGGYLHAELVMR